MPYASKPKMAELSSATSPENVLRFASQEE